MAHKRPPRLEAKRPKQKPFQGSFITTTEHYVYSGGKKIHGILVVETVYPNGQPIVVAMDDTNHIHRTGDTICQFGSKEEAAQKMVSLHEESKKQQSA